MKKIISLALCLVLSSFVLAGCSDNSEPFEEKSYTPDTQVNEINLDVRDRKIEVSLSEDEQVHIQYYENRKEYYNISVSDENVLNMTSTSDKEWQDYIGRNVRRFLRDGDGLVQPAAFQCRQQGQHFGGAGGIAPLPAGGFKQHLATGAVHQNAALREKIVFVQRIRPSEIIVFRGLPSVNGQVAA